MVTIDNSEEIVIPTGPAEAARVLWFEVLGFSNDRFDSVLAIETFLKGFVAAGRWERSFPIGDGQPKPIRPLPEHQGRMQSIDGQPWTCVDCGWTEGDSPQEHEPGESRR